MQNEFENEAKIAIQRWRDSQAEVNPADHADLTPALSRLLGWLNEGKDCEQKGMRVITMLAAVRPDFIEKKSLGRMSPTSKRVFDELANDFKRSFHWQPGHQIVKRSRI